MKKVKVITKNVFIGDNISNAMRNISDDINTFIDDNDYDLCDAKFNIMNPPSNESAVSVIIVATIIYEDRSYLPPITRSKKSQLME